MWVCLGISEQCGVIMVFDNEITAFNKPKMQCRNIIPTLHFEYSDVI